MSNLLTMVLSERDRMADRKIAKILNELEDLQIKRPDPEKFIHSIETLRILSNDYPNRFRNYIDEIKGCVEEVIEFYKRENKTIPDISFLYG